MLLLSIFTFLLVYSFSFSSAADINWCQESLQCTEVKNTMCKYTREPENMRNCSKMMDIARLRMNRLYWLALHNTFRDQVASGSVPGLPPAANMKQLTWRVSLANQARRFLFQCKDLTADPCNKHPKFDRLGQVFHEIELAFEGTATAEMKNLFLAIVGQYGSFPVEIIDSYKSIIYNASYMLDGVLFVAEIINAKARFIGGAVLNYTWTEDGNEQFFLLSHTNFGPGAVSGQPLYRRGKPCSNCPKGTSCKRNSNYKHLCAETKDHNDEPCLAGLPGLCSAGQVFSGLHPLLVPLTPVIWAFET